jgi:hypothetical protein
MLPYRPLRLAKIDTAKMMEAFDINIPLGKVASYVFHGRHVLFTIKLLQNVLNFCVHYLHHIGWVYVFYVGHVDGLYETLFHTVIQVNIIIIIIIR